MSTTNTAFESLDLEAKLAALPPNARAALACASAELVSELDTRVRVSLHQSDNGAIRKALNMAWLSVENSQPLARNAHKALLPLIPDDDDPGWSVARGILGNTTAAAAYAVWATEQDGIVNAKWALVQVFDVAEFYSRYRHPSLDNDALDGLPLMKWTVTWIDRALHDATVHSPRDLRSSAETSAPAFAGFFDLFAR